MAGNASDTATDSYSGSGNDSWGQSQQGTYSNFSYSFSSYVEHDGGSESATENDTATDSFSGTLTNNGGNGANFSYGGQIGLTSLSLLSNDTGTGSTSLTETITDQSNTTTSSSDTWSDYQAGSFSGNSLSLSSVSSSDTGSDSWSTQGSDTVSTAGQETFLSGSTFVYNAVSPSGSSATVSQSETVTLSDTVSGTDTASSQRQLQFHWRRHLQCVRAGQLR